MGFVWGYYMENNKLPDIPWHVGYTKKKESDPRRHKARCRHLKDGICRCGYDGCYTQKCGGSSHCTHYSEKLNDVEERREELRLAMAIRDNFAQPKGKIIIEITFYRGKKYYKIYLSESESLLVPYKPYITKQEILSYIKQYRNPKSTE